MSKFLPTINIDNLSSEERKALQPGQWVRAGEDGPTGRFFGEGASTVVAWSKRLPKGKRHFEYLKRYAQFGRESRTRAA